MTHTKDLLAAELRKVGLDDMADHAADGYYHDYLSPLATPELQLVEDLALASALNPNHEQDILKLRRRVINGDFDATKEESDEWANSPEGQEAYRQLIRGKGDG